MDVCLAACDNCDTFLERYKALFRLSNLDILVAIESSDQAVLDLKKNLCWLLIGYVTAGLGLSLRKKGLSQVSEQAWDFCKNSHVRRLLQLSVAEFSFLAIHASRYLQSCGGLGNFLTLYTEALPLILKSFQTFCTINQDQPMHLFLYQRAQVIQFPLSIRIRHIVRVNFDTGEELNWVDECTCGSHIPYGECCGLYR
ncbi:MAG: hypothetical protein ACRCVN_03865 [Spirochaetia bacterium]